LVVLGQIAQPNLILSLSKVEVWSVCGAPWFDKLTMRGLFVRP
jgi:hypothetical protein